MNRQKIKHALEVLREAEEILLDLPIGWQEEAAEKKDIDTLNTSNGLAEIIGWLDDKFLLQQKSDGNLDHT